ncbi:MAG TPA: hypothetical protein PLK99_03510, partial [Burkholderiales bacterium]|nr:hypothetical protein [Burkholderiales bacterium]
HVVSIVSFDLEENGLMNIGCSVRIMQPLDAPCESAQLEISHPVNYAGPLDFEAFTEAVTCYYREACREGMQKTWRRMVEFELHPVFRKA